MRTLTWRQKGLIGTFCAASMVALIAGCSGGGSSDDASTSASPTPVCSPIAPMLSVLQTTIFTPSCSVGGSTCHSGTAPQNGFDTSTSAKILMTASNVVAVETFNSMGVVRVVPGSHASSYVWLKITGATGITPTQMPQTGQTLSSCAIDAIGAWIDAGAQNN